MALKCGWMVSRFFGKRIFNHLFQGEDDPMHRCSSDANRDPVHTAGIPNTIAADQTFCFCLRD